MCDDCPTPAACAKSGCQMTPRAQASQQLAAMSKTITVTKPTRKTVQPLK
jgi:hypothetical protein